MAPSLAKSTFATATTTAAATLLLLFSSLSSTVHAQTVNPGTAPWQHIGCLTDNNGGRTFGVLGLATDSLTVNMCTAECQRRGYLFAGVEYARECFCGNNFGSQNTWSTNGGCNMPCAGKATELCGGPNRINAYVIGNWASLGCYADVPGSRTLSDRQSAIAGGNTKEKCRAVCAAKGFKFAGVEFGSECWCGNSIRSGRTNGQSGCTVACQGNSGQTCGGSNRIEIFRHDRVTGGVTTTTTNPPTTTTRPPTTTTASPLPSGFIARGCYVDNVRGRILQNQQPDDPQLTHEKCINRCASLGYPVAGVQFHTQCFCDTGLRHGDAAAPAPASECNTPCGGNAATMCGGPNRFNIFSQGTLKVWGEPAAQKTGLPGQWQYQGCLRDNINDKYVFRYKMDYPTTNTATNCLTQCQRFGFTAAGLEYGRECFCGDLNDVTAAGAGLVSEAECNIACSGDSEYLCGGGSRLSYYRWIGTPIARWNFASGNAAGQYRFLMGGVVVPLITSVAMNGKVTFLEKHGTGPPNSTGAYEFDPLEPDFNKAWRTMNGIKTDVFCAAGLTLPDKVGRQINIGGWAGEDLKGVRLYWPDGPTNDWEENINTLKLKEARWYPTGMILANGSMLVVGGEFGANGPPTPNLEILPVPPGGYVKHLDWLERTDPFNLYPYLVVLPSGNIFVAYYNEARLLDPSTFDTVKVLPNMPGSVDRPDGGRTYPNEGVFATLPQYAPYTDPLGVIMCGGSSPGFAQAIDNCVTTYPDVANPTWTIERMPSRRVIGNMVGLPDGTFLIMNGAHEGVAGFGLASDPNLNAVLYDPSKPVNQRFTVMANTTIARMYHSEAILLLDGRVLVSGSDPQDPRYPQEYRVEVFIPPYLMGTPARPTFTVSSKDWEYGQTVDVTIPQGVAGVKISLNAAVSSTHGYNMGQRTIFPATTCSGTVCRVTAPPNANISPPGWHMLFVLKNGVPSIGQWVRIGGDPAGLGNWPPGPDFSRPGL